MPSGLSLLFLYENYMKKSLGRVDPGDHSSQNRENDTTIIRWYTEDSFFYGMINNTIREGDILNIFFIRIGIYLLYSQLKNLSKQQNYKSITLYRGCVLNKKEFEVWEIAKQPFIM